MTRTKLTDEERKARHRESQRRYRERLKREKVFHKAVESHVEDLMSINLSPEDKEAQKAEEKKARRRESQRRYREKLKRAKVFHKAVESHVDDLMSIDLGPTPTRSKTVSRSQLSEAKRQLGLAMSRINKGNARPGLNSFAVKRIGSVDFELGSMDQANRSFLFSKLPGVINELLNKISLNDRWTVYYRYVDPQDGSEAWRQRTIDSFTSGYLRDQLEEELVNDVPWEEFAEEHTSGDSFFPVSLRLLKELRFINEDEVGLRGRANNGNLLASDFRSGDDYRIYRTLVDSGASKKTITRFVNKHVKAKREGAFWKWINCFPELNLERFGIFSEVSPRTIQLVSSDNCFVYALERSNVPSWIVSDLRDSVHKRFFTLSDVKTIAERFNLRLVITCEGRVVSLGNPEADVKVDLLLIHKHYMVNEKVPISPFYVRNRDAILNSKQAMAMSPAKRLTISWFDGTFYHTSSRRYKLQSVLEAMFEVGAFTKLTLGQVMQAQPPASLSDELSYDESTSCHLVKVNGSQTPRAYR